MSIRIDTPVVHGFAAETRWRPAPLRVRVASFDQQSYGYGQPFVVRIAVENVGSEDVALPWSASTELFKAPDARLLSIGIALHAQAPGGPTLTIRLPFLYGVTSDPGSLNVLRPGDSAEIIAPGLFEGESLQDEIRPGAEKDFVVRASLRWHHAENGTAYLPVESDRGPVVRLHARGEGVR